MLGFWKRLSVDAQPNLGLNLTINKIGNTDNMEKETISKLNKTFEEYAYEQDGVEYWLARELQNLLGYSEWRNFLNAVVKAKVSCETSGQRVIDHFVDINKTIPMPKGAEKQNDDMIM